MRALAEGASAAIASSRRSDAPGSHRTGPPAITRPGPEGSIAKASTRFSTFLRGSIPPTNRAYRPSIPYLRRTSLTASSEAGANAATSTPSGVTCTRPASISWPASRSLRVAIEGTTTPAARLSHRSKERRQRGFMCGAMSSRRSWARSCTTITTPSRCVAGGRKLVASSTSKSTDHSMRGIPTRFDKGPNTRAGKRDASSDRLSAFTPAKNRRGRSNPFACRYQAT